MFKALEDYTEIPTKPWIARVNSTPDSNLCLNLPVTGEKLQRAYNSGRLDASKYEKAKAVGFLIIAYMWHKSDAITMTDTYKIVVINQSIPERTLSDKNSVERKTFKEAIEFLEELEYSLLKEPKYATMYKELEAKRLSEQVKTNLFEREFPEDSWRSSFTGNWEQVQTSLDVVKWCEEI